MQNEYGSKGFTVLALSDEGPAVVERFVKDQKLTYPIGVDPGGKTKRSYGVRGIPQAFLINVDGRVIWEGHPGDPSAYQKQLEAELIHASTYVPPKPLHAGLQKALDKAKTGEFAEAIKLARAAEAAGDDRNVLLEGLGAKAKARLARAKGLHEDEGRTYEAQLIFQDLATRYAGLPEADEAKALLDQWKKDKAIGQSLAVSQSFYEAEEAEAKGSDGKAKQKYMTVAKATGHKLAAKAEERIKALH